MANTYTQIHIQAVFVVKYRNAIIRQAWEDELYKYIMGIINAQGHKPLAINGMPDHIHVLFGMRPLQSLSDLMQDIKGSSSKWINNHKLAEGHFEWQQGYGAFSYSRSHVDTVISYIRNQKQHHTNLSFMEEYKKLLDEFQIDYDERYVFKEPE